MYSPPWKLRRRQPKMYIYLMTTRGLIEKLSNHSVEETVDRIKTILQSKGVTLFALVDHSGEAAKVGMKMPPTRLLIFGNPKAGTPLMLAAPTSAIDLPLKILVREDAEGKVWVSYNSPAYLMERHGLPEDLLQNIAVVETLASAATSPEPFVAPPGWRETSPLRCPFPDCTWPDRRTDSDRRLGASRTWLAGCTAPGDHQVARRTAGTARV